MKNIFKITLLLLTVMFASCSKSWLDVNNDPNYASEVTPELILPSAIASSASVIGGQYNILGCVWSQYWTQSNGANQYKDIDRYNLINSDYDNQFRRIYAGAFQDYKYIESHSDSTEGIYLMSTVMEAYSYQVMADLYDKIPYTEACRADEGIYHPHYDSCQVVYNSLIIKINRALDNVSSSKTLSSPSQDLIFGGDLKKWKQFANTLKLKIYLRQLYIPNRKSIVEKGIEDLFKDPNGFLTTDAAMTQFQNETSKSNPTYEDNVRTLNVGTNLRMSSTLYFYMKEKNDTDRIHQLFYNFPGVNLYQPLGQGDYALTTSDIDPNIVTIATMHPTDPVYFISTAESYFLQAEAVAYGKENGWSINSDDKTLYNEGVSAAFEKYGLDATNFITTGGAYEYPSAGNFEAKQKAIITQKWLSMIGSEGLEMVFEHNRTHYPVADFTIYSMASDHKNMNDSYVPGTYVKPSGAVSTYKDIPQRLLFPESERQRNPNCPAEVPIATKVWWAKKAK